jgi:predicted nucleic acid-binding protein
MSAADVFIDTSVLLCLLSADEAKAGRVEDLLVAGGTISVQVLNEFAAVGTRELRMSIADVREVLDTVRAVCEVHPVAAATHDRAMDLAERYGFSFYDAVLVAAAILAGCSRLYAEDLQHGQLVDRRLRIVNPFRAA